MEQNSQGGSLDMLPIRTENAKGRACCGWDIGKVRHEMRVTPGQNAVSGRTHLTLLISCRRAVKKIWKPAEGKQLQKESSWFWNEGKATDIVNSYVSIKEYFPLLKSLKYLWLWKVKILALSGDSPIDRDITHIETLISKGVWTILFDFKSSVFDFVE